MDAGGLKPNTWHRFERLNSAWNQARVSICEEPGAAADDEPGVVANPRRQPRTPLTESQVDAIRTARANGESVVSICRRFEVHRMTVWTHTKDLVAQARPARGTSEAGLVDTSILRPELTLRTANPAGRSLATLRATTTGV